MNMTLNLLFYLCYFLKTLFPACGGDDNINLISNDLNEISRTVQLARPGLIDLLQKVAPADEKVSVRVYYQCLCPSCIDFVSNLFPPVLTKLNSYLDIKTYPYGNAQTIERNGTYEFVCQNGPLECYGNKLHACALDLIQNKTEALLFNSCMTAPRESGRSSDDVSADKCAVEFNVNARSIKECAKGGKGDRLLKYYGDESEKVTYRYLPYVLINGKRSMWRDFGLEVCAAFVNQPPQCDDI